MTQRDGTSKSDKWRSGAKAEKAPAKRCDDPTWAPPADVVIAARPPVSTRESMQSTS